MSACLPACLYYYLKESENKYVVERFGRHVPLSRGAHLKVGIQGEALIPGEVGVGGLRSFEGALIRGGTHSRGHSFKNQRFRGVGRSFDRETAVILEAELKKWKELFSHFDFTVENIPIARFPAALSKKYGS